MLGDDNLAIRCLVLIWCFLLGRWSCYSYSCGVEQSGKQRVDNWVQSPSLELGSFWNGCKKVKGGEQEKQVTGKPYSIDRCSELLKMKEGDI